MTEAPSPDDPQRQRLRKALRGAALFSDLDATTLDAVERELTPISLPGGAALFRDGDPADAIYIVASGCLGVFRKDPDNPEPVLIAELPAGEIAGEMSLLAQGPRTRTVAALRDSEVWALARADFDRLTAAHPEALNTLTRKVATRNAFAKPRRGAQPRTFAVLPTGPHVSASRFSVTLASALGGLNQLVQVLGPESYGQSPEWFTTCEADAAYIIYRADPTPTAVDRAVPAPGRLPDRAAQRR